MSHGGEVDATADLDDLVSVLLTASRALVAVSASSLAEVEDLLTLSEFRALVVLQGRGACREPTLARRLAVSAATGQRVVARLLEGDYVGRGDDGVLSLTPRGEEIVRRVTQRRRTAVAEIAGRMEVDERRVLVDALVAFARAAGEPLVAD